ncbi:hypothetical ala-%2C pro-rich protein [Mycobacterium tuberculosis]|nr:hypothetical ala-%2C pro-rich protein [Mycobacterium tuberculosis]CNW66068.1 hypothetical ala-%2C pro-rich protein [Mycobacterium tuberculosis]
MVSPCPRPSRCRMCPHWAPSQVCRHIFRPASIHPTPRAPHPLWHLRLRRRSPRRRLPRRHQHLTQPNPTQQLPGLPALAQLSPIIQQAAMNPAQATQLLMAAASAFAGNPAVPTESKNVASSVNQFVAEPTNPDSAALGVPAPHGVALPEAIPVPHVPPLGAEPGVQAHLPTGIDPSHAAGPAPAVAPTVTPPVAAPPASAPAPAPDAAQPHSTATGLAGVGPAESDNPASGDEPGTGDATAHGRSVCVRRQSGSAHRIQERRFLGEPVCG